MRKLLLVSRHLGAANWVRRYAGIRGADDIQVLAHLDVNDLSPGDTVIGTLPILRKQR